MASRTSVALWSQRFQRSPESNMSLQGQIRQMLVAAILDGQLLPNHALPSSRELADQLSVARNTVVLAYQQLVEEGYLISRERSGHFVNPAILEGRHEFCAAADGPRDRRPMRRSRGRIGTSASEDGRPRSAISSSRATG